MRRFRACIVMLLALLAAAGCEDKALVKELTAYKAQTQAEEQNMATLRRLIEEVNENKSDLVAAAAAADFALHSPSASPSPLSLDALLEMREAYRQAFPDLRLEILNMFAESDRVAVRVRVTGTQRGEFKSIAATGRTFESGGLIIARFDAGKLVEAWADVDLTEVFRQLGLTIKLVSAAPTDSEVREMIIRQSLRIFDGSCPCPYNTAPDGSSCGARSVYSRRGPLTALCFEQDVTDSMVERYRETLSRSNL